MKRLDFDEPLEDFEEINENRERDYPSKTNKHIILGAILIAAGILIVGNRSGILPDFVYRLFFNWQMLLIGIGSIMLFNERKSTSGIIMIIIGVAFLAPKFIFVPLGMKHLFFPALLIVAGALIIFRNKNGKDQPFEFSKAGTDYSNDILNETYIFGGSNLNVVSDNFKGGQITAIFGGGQLDLRNVELCKTKRPILKIDAIFGGMEIIVPTDWNVVLKTNNIFGGFSFKKNGIHRSQIDKSKEIVIIANAIFGGGDIKRV